jgi:hypothetical protein
MIKIHVISDLDLGFNEFVDPVDETLPVCDLVVFNSLPDKRHVLYVETLCKKYPNIQFLINGAVPLLSMPEQPPGLSNQLTARQLLSSYWPSNLHVSCSWPISITIDNQKLDILCMYGTPKFSNPGVDISQSLFARQHRGGYGLTTDHSLFRPKAAHEVWHGEYPMIPTAEICNLSHGIEEQLVKKWELNYNETSGKKLLLTRTSPLQDPTLSGINYSIYSGIHLDQGIWITAHKFWEKIIYLGAKLLANPGRGAEARARVFEV